jgi:hypothetical protein
MIIRSDPKKKCGYRKNGYRGKSGYVGVTWFKAKKKYTVNVKFRNKLYYAGLYADIEEAAEAYIRKFIELHGYYPKCYDL